MARQILELTAPSHWASYLINGDASGLANNEQRAIDRWLAAEGLSSPVSCEDAGYCRDHDALWASGFAADCQTYTFFVED